MHTILILEADPKIATILQTQLEKRQYSVSLHTDYSAAKESLALTAPDLFLIDLNTARDGFFPDFYSWLIKDDTMRFLPRVFIEGSNKEALGQEVRRQSNDVILKKPLRMSQLLQHIGQLLGTGETGGLSASGILSTSAAAQPRRQATLPPEPNPQQSVDQRLAAFVGRQIGNVVLEKEIGRGGMGAVFLGQQTTLARQVAVKVMLPDLVGETAALTRFRREALAIARLKSPHIVQVFDAGTTTDDVFYIVMEYLEGGTLDDHLRMYKRCTLPQAIEIISQVASGLAVAHEAGLIHRDLKPSNLMINKAGHVTITDFGLVREHGIEETDKLTKQGSLLGTPYYLSPEQASGIQLDPRTDLYSLGIIGYELLVGDVPFTSNNLLDILVMHHNLPLPDPRIKNADIPEVMVQILMKLAAKKAEQRYTNANELLQDLSSFQGAPATASQSPQAAPMSITPNSQGQNFKLTSGTGKRLEAFAQESDSALHDKQAEGKAIMRASGEIAKREGNFDDSWIRALSLSVGVIQQLQTLPGLGEWSFAQLETPDRMLHVHPHETMFEAILLQPDRAQASMSLRGGTETMVSAPPTSADPLEQIASIVGVHGVLVFDTNGQLLKSRINTTTELEQFRIRLAPLPQLMQSLPISLVGMESTYQNGRVFLWDLDDQILFVIGTTMINKTILTMLLANQLNMLKARRSSPASLSASIYPNLPSDQTASPELMKQIKKTFARSIGPIADLTLKKVAKRMGYSRKSFPKDQLSDLLQELSEALDPAKREEFLNKALPLLSEEK